MESSWRSCREYCEGIREAARREFKEETGLDVEIRDVLEVNEVVIPERPYHSIAIIFLGINPRGKIKSEKSLRYGVKTPRWFSATGLETVKIHPQSAIIKAIGKDSVQE